MSKENFLKSSKSFCPFSADCVTVSRAFCVCSNCEVILIIFEPTPTRLFTLAIRVVIPATAESVEGLIARKASSRVCIDFSVFDD